MKGVTLEHWQMLIVARGEEQEKNSPSGEELTRPVIVAGKEACVKARFLKPRVALPGLRFSGSVRECPSLSYPHQDATILCKNNTRAHLKSPWELYFLRCTVCGEDAGGRVK